MRPIALPRLVTAAAPALVVLAACGGASPAARDPAPARPAAPRAAADDAPPVDPIAALAPGADSEQVTLLVPGRARLEIDGPPIDEPGGDRPLEVAVIQRVGDLVRVAVRLAHARLSLWTERDRLYAVLAAEHRLAEGAALAGPGGGPEVGVTLRAGARVRRLAHRGGAAAATRVRYSGAVEVEGWVPDRLLDESAPRRDPPLRYPSGSRWLHVFPGAVIRTEPRWSAPELAVMAEGFLVDVVREVDPAWAEVTYADGEVAVHGYLSAQAPPGRVHRPRDPDVPLPVSTPNAKVASGTCLYARPRGEPIGYIVGDQDVQLEDRGGSGGRGGPWWALVLDTPWGPLELAARGPAPGELAACAPPGSVPPPAGASSSPSSPQLSPPSSPPSPP